MIITGYSAANQFLDPAFFGIVSTQNGGGTKTVMVTPDPVPVDTTVTPADKTVEGVLVKFPVFPGPVELRQAPAIPVQIPTAGGETKVNAFESVGVLLDAVPRLCALVRPNVIAACRHYDTPNSYVGMRVRFYGSAGQQDAKVIGIALTRGDFQLYYLDQAITMVKPVAIAPLQDQSWYSGRPFVIFGLFGSRSSNFSSWVPVAAKNTLAYAFSNGPAQGGTWFAYALDRATSPDRIEPGDSGSPCFFFDGTTATYLGSVYDRTPLNLDQINMASPWAADISSL